MSRFAVALQMARRMPVWLIAVCAAAGIAGLIWVHGGLTAKRAAQVEALKIERDIREVQDRTAEDLRDEFDEIEEGAAAAGDDAVLERLQRGHFAIAPGFAAPGP